MNLQKGIKCNEKIIQQIAIGMFFCIVSFVFLLKSPLHIWIGGDSGIDSSVFKTVAMMMDNGYMPYRDTFDHKGPYLYLLNWLGMQISYYRGVWVVEFVNMFITLIALYKIARIKCNPGASIVSVMVSISLLFTYFQGGNFVEEYAMSLIGISLYIFLDYMVNGIVNKRRLILCGFCFGGVLLLRANMISVWMVFCFAIFIKCLVEGKYCGLRKFITFFTIGMSIIIIPFVIWLLIEGALGDFWNSYIVFNMQYSSWAKEGTVLSYRWDAFFSFLNKTVLIFATMITVYLCAKKEKFVYITYLCYIVLTLVLLSLSGRTFEHYGMIMIPMITFPIASLYSILEVGKDGKALALVVSLYFICVIVMPNWLDLSSTVISTYEKRYENNHSRVVTEVCEIVDSLTTPEDRISVYGNWDVIYVLTNRLHATKYSYQIPIGTVSKEIMEDYLQQLRDELPKLIIVQDDYYDDNIGGFLKENSYHLIWQQTEDELQDALIYQYSK